VSGSESLKAAFSKNSVFDVGYEGTQPLLENLSIRKLAGGQSTRSGNNIYYLEQI
jgi:hypothetical protein